MRCFFCEGVAHPTTGHYVTPNVLQCGPCHREFIRWYRARMHNPIALVALQDLELAKYR